MAQLKVTVIKEAGHIEALLGMSLSHYSGEETIKDWWSNEKIEKAKKRAKKLAHMQGGHNKFLESIQVWAVVNASRGFWQEADTYRVGVTKNSASTMHTIKKRVLSEKDFIDGTGVETIVAINKVVKEQSDINVIKANLPEGFMQARQVCLNYKALQNIYAQRQSHRLTQWQDFCEQIVGQIGHPEYIVQPS